MFFYCELFRYSASAITVFLSFCESSVNVFKSFCSSIGVEFSFLLTAERISFGTSFFPVIRYSTETPSTCAMRTAISALGIHPREPT